MISCRAMSSDDGTKIVEMKEELDLQIAKTPGVEFLVSCVTDTTSNPKMAINSSDESSERRTRKGVAFFIVTRTEAIEDDIIRIIHDVGSSDHNVTYIKPRKHRESKDIALAALSQVVKVSNIY